MNEKRTDQIVEYLRDLASGINKAPRGQVVIDFAGPSIAIRVSATIDKSGAQKAS